METGMMLADSNVKGIDAIAKAQEIVISNGIDYARADQFCASLKNLEKEVDAAFDEHIQAAYIAHKALVSKKKTFVSPIEEARRIIKGKLIAFEDFERSRIAAEEARLTEIARKKAEEDAIAAAAEAQARGDHEIANAIISTPVEAMPIHIQADIPKRQTQLRTVWKFKIVNKSLIPKEYLTVDSVALGKVVAATKGAITIPGVEIYSERV